MKKYYIFLMVLFVVSCGSSNNDAESIDFDDFAGNTGVEGVDSTDENLLSFEENLTNMLSLINKMSIEYDTVTAVFSHPIDRFNFSTTEKMRFEGKSKVPYGNSSMVTPVADFYYYTFSDSNKTINAFYNYLDILSENGESEQIKLNQDVKSIKTAPLFMAVYDTIIITAKYKCEHKENDWGAFQDSIFKVYGKNYKYQIDVDCGGPLKWK